MSKLMLVACICFLLAGCSAPSADEFGFFDHEIAFKTYMGRQVKAVEKGSFDRGDSFFVYASHTSSNNTLFPTTFDGLYFASDGTTPTSVSVTKQPSDELTPDRKVFWPDDDNYLDFLAVMNNTPPAAYSLSFSPALLSFQQSADAGFQHDLLVSVATGRRYSLNPVTFVFRHILAKLQFSAQVDSPDAKYKVNVISVTVGGVCHKGCYSFTGQSDDGVSPGLWSLDTQAEMNDCSAKLIQADVKNDASTPLVASDGALLLIPQSATALHVVYDLYYNSGTAESPLYDKIATESSRIDLASGVWKAGKL